MTRTLILGLDGSTWDMLSPLIDKGELENFARFRDSGTWATNNSCLPPTTFPNWKCYSSGKNPGKFGAFWFEQVDIERGEITPVNASDFDTAEVWDYLNDDGLTTGVINMPTMYPAREIEGIMITGGADSASFDEYVGEDNDCTYPPELTAELSERYDYEIHPDAWLSSTEPTEKEISDLHDLLKLRLQVTYDYVMESDLDFIHVTLSKLNHLRHYLWDDEPTIDALKLIDEWLGKFLEIEDLNTVLMSDHGCAPIHTEFYLNEWLIEEGYLQRSETPGSRRRSIGLTKSNVVSLLDRLHLLDTAVNYLPRTLKDTGTAITADGAEVGSRDRKLSFVDIDESQGIASGHGVIYLRKDSQYDQVKREIIRKLKQETDENNDPLFNAVYNAAEIYSGPYVEEGPDILLDYVPGVHINDAIGKGEVKTSRGDWAAENARPGIFAAHGPDIRHEGHIDPIDMVDIAPTLLAIHGVDIPSDMDGEIIPVVTNNVGTQDPLTDHSKSNAGHKDGVEDRLRGLGYIQ